MTESKYDLIKTFFLNFFTSKSFAIYICLNVDLPEAFLETKI